MTLDSTAATSIQSGQPWTVDRFQPADAEGVTRLFLSVYGSGYPIKTYLKPNLLIRENAARRTISSVARTPRGDIVGHNALFNSAPHPGTYESGAGLVHAVYRGGKGIFSQLVSHGLELAAGIPEVEVVFGEPVCNHPYTQKMCVKQGFTSRALEVDLMPAAAYAQEASAGRRVSAFLDFMTLRQNPHRVHLPARYTKELTFFYEGMHDQRDFLTARCPVPAASVTDMRAEVFDFAGVARIAVHATGRNFSERLDTLERELTAKGVIVVQIWLNLGEPWVGEAVETLCASGYFLGGVLPGWFFTDGLLMQKIRQPPDWDNITAHTNRYRQILASVRADWQRSIKENHDGN
jgi:hypothetical protein